LQPKSKEFGEILKALTQDVVGIEYLQSYQFSDEILNELENNLRKPHSVEKLKAIRDLKISMVDELEINNQVSNQEVNERLEIILGEESFLPGQTWYNYIIGKDKDSEQFLNRKEQVSKAIDYCWYYRDFFES